MHIFLAVMLACGDKEPKDSGPESDTDTDADTDTDTDTDSDSDTDTDASACDGVALDPNSGCLDIDGDMALTPEGSAYNGSGSGEGLLRIYMAQTGYGNPSFAIDVDDTVTAGTLSCLDGNTIVAATAEDGTYMGANVDLDYYGAWCSLTFDAVGTTVGDAVEGSFTGEFYDYSSQSLIPVSGSFKTEVLW